MITHCNTGPLATAGEGTALGVIIGAHQAGKRIHVYADETRPLLQGARLTTVECRAAGVPITLIADGAAAATIRLKDVRCAIVGADRIAANGDSANKIGTYGLAIACAHHGIPFYIAAPRSTIDFGLASGDGIPIEERRPHEVREIAGVATAPVDVDVFNPAFDVTPAALIAGIVTEYGVLRAPYERSIPPLAALPALAGRRREILRVPRQGAGDSEARVHRRHRAPLRRSRAGADRRASARSRRTRLQRRSDRCDRCGRADARSARRFPRCRFSLRRGSSSPNGYTSCARSRGAISGRSLRGHPTAMCWSSKISSRRRASAPNR